MDTLSEVREWINASLYHPDNSITYDMDLYTTPPRTSLPLGVTLHDLHLVPAVIIYVSWRTELFQPDAVGALDQVLSQRLEGGVEPRAGWNYLNEEMYLQAHHSIAKSGDGAEEASGSEDVSSESHKKRAFPTGRRLADGLELLAASKGDDDGDLDGSVPRDPSAAGSKRDDDGSEAKKPKWLKI